MTPAADVLGDYRLLEALGPGMLGQAYRARDTRLGRTVQITILSESIEADRDARDRLLAAARLAATLSHPNIATLYEVGADGERSFLVQEFVQGQSLKALVGGRPLNPHRAIDLAIEIADALAAAHAAEVAHGALDAAAIVVTPKGHAKILDFGLRALTAPGVDPASDDACRDDIARLGSILFEMLIGTPPVPGASLPGVIVRAIPTEIDPIVAKAIGEAGVYESAATLAEDLRQLSAMLDARKAALDRQPPTRRASRGPGVRARLFVAGLALLALAVLAWWYLRNG